MDVYLLFVIIFQYIVSNYLDKSLVLITEHSPKTE